MAQPYAGGAVYQVTPTLDLSASLGQPLDAATRRMMEEAFGTGFGDVRVHVGPEAASLGARAFKTGAHLFL